jgi:hypothetical protein
MVLAVEPPNILLSDAPSFLYGLAGVLPRTAVPKLSWYSNLQTRELHPAKNNANESVARENRAKVPPPLMGKLWRTIPQNAVC